MNTKLIIKKILADKECVPKKEGFAFAPVNFALIKYWGKRNPLLHLPMTPSLSLALPEKGAFTRIFPIEKDTDEFFFNQQLLQENHIIAKRATDFLNLFRRKKGTYFRIETQMNLPASSGLASSACGFAALTLALNELFGWQLTKRELSILARLGSGSACRSLWEGFVEWHAGSRNDGMDSYAEPIDINWNALCMGLLILDPEKKKISSRDAMRQTVETSCYYPTWPHKVARDIKALKQAIVEKDFETFGKTCESNALAMHASMLTAWPPILYWTEKSLQTIQKIWQLRQEGLSIYFTQDAGPNLKLLFLHKDLPQIQAEFNDVEIVWPFIPPNGNNQVVLVNEKDHATGIAEKMTAHQQALCHRAFSIFIFREKKGALELLIQQRQKDKYHCGGLWTNTCCSHPQPGESLLTAAERRLKEEIDIYVPLRYKGFFHYIAKFDNQLTENEVDHVFVGYDSTENFSPNTEEVAELRWVKVKDLQQELTNNPQSYTPWFKQALDIAII